MTGLHLINHHYGQSRSDIVNSPTSPQRQRAGREDRSAPARTGRPVSALFRNNCQADNACRIFLSFAILVFFSNYIETTFLFVFFFFFGLFS
jgi:hypothetical protein